MIILNEFILWYFILKKNNDLTIKNISKNVNLFSILKDKLLIKDEPLV